MAVDRRLGEQAAGVSTERTKATQRDRGHSKPARRKQREPDDVSDEGANRFDTVTSDERNVVHVAGPTLQIILSDETLTKVFLMLCSMSGLCVGSSVQAY